MMKRTAILALVICMILGFSACGSNEQNSSAESSTTAPAIEEKSILEGTYEANVGDGEIDALVFYGDGTCENIHSGSNVSSSNFSEQGEYIIEEDTIILVFGGQTVKCDYVMSGDTLILTFEDGLGLAYKKSK